VRSSSTNYTQVRNKEWLIIVANTNKKEDEIRMPETAGPTTTSIVRAALDEGLPPGGVDRPMECSQLLEAAYNFPVLVSAPPFSGKTSLAQLLCKVLRVSFEA
jgi:hypothetical protein